MNTAAIGLKQVNKRGNMHARKITSSDRGATMQLRNHIQICGSEKSRHSGKKRQKIQHQNGIFKTFFYINMICSIIFLICNRKNSFIETKPPNIVQRIRKLRLKNQQILTKSEDISQQNKTCPSQIFSQRMRKNNSVIIMWNNCH